MSGSGTGTPASGAPSLTVAGRTDVPYLLERVSGPSSEPITLAEMKLHLRTFASDTDEDDLISALITSAREWVENYTGRALMDQSWRITINGGFTINQSAGDNGWWPASSITGWGWWLQRREILLRKSPLISITSFVTVDAAGAETAVDAATYALTERDSKWPRIAGLNSEYWTGSTLKVEFRAGYSDATLSPPEGAEVVPVRFIQAMKLHAEAHYDRDERMMEKLLMAAENLVKPERCDMSFA